MKQKSQIAIFAQPVKVAKEWLETLTNPTQEDVDNIIQILMMISSIYVDAKKLKLVDYNDFVNKYNDLQTVKAKFLPVNKKQTYSQLIEFFKDIAKDVIYLAKDKKSEPILQGLVVFAGCFVWMQLGIKFSEIIKEAKKIGILDK